MRIAHASYDPETGISVVTLKQGEDFFTGVVALHEDDAEIASSFAGCQFAEIKARIKLLKRQYREEKKKLLTLKNMYQQMTELRDFDELYVQTVPMRFFRKQIHIQEAKVNDIRNQFQELEESYKFVVDDRLTLARELPDVLELRRNMIESLNKIEEKIDGS